MKHLKALVKKEFSHILRDPRSLLILLGMPIVQVLLFGFALTNEIKQARIVLLDHSKDRVTRQIRRELFSSGYFILKEELQSPAQLEKAFQKHHIKLALVFEPEFAEKLEEDHQAALQVITDASNPNTAITLTNYVRSIAGKYTQKHSNTSGYGRIQTKITMAYNPGQKGVFLFVPGVITVILMLISAMMTSITIAREKEMGNMEILLVSPLKPLSIIIGKTIPYILLSFTIGVTLLIMGRFVFGLPIEGSLWLLFMESLIFISTTLSLGILISTITHTQQSALLISLAGLMLPTILLSGFIFPLESMPKVLQWLSYLIPARWFNQIIKEILLKGNGLDLLWKETFFLTGMSLVFIFLSVKNFKTRLQ